MAKTKIGYLEGLRGLAALAVFFVHINPVLSIFPPLSENQNKDFLSFVKYEFYSTFLNGDFPVILFWIMSSYVISLPFFKFSNPESQTLFLRAAAVKRYFRLVIPIAAISFISFLFLKLNLYNHHLRSLSQYSEHQNWINLCFNFEPNFFHFIKTTFIDVFIIENCSYDPVLWTMKIELLGSFLCFAILSFLGSAKYRKIIFLFLFCFFVLSGFSDRTYFFYSCFIFGLICLDAEFSEIFNRRKSLCFLSGFLILLATFIVPALVKYFQAGWDIRLIYFIAFPIRAMSLFAVIFFSEKIRKYLSNKILLWFGKISFSLYLLHVLVIMSLSAYLKIHLTNSVANSFLIFLLTFTVSLLLAAIYEKYVDRPSKKWSKKISGYLLN